MGKVLFVLTTLGQGGAEQYTLRYMNYDHDSIFTVMTTLGIGGVLEDDFQKVSRVVMKYKSGYLNISNRIWLFKFLKKEQFDTIIDMHGCMSGILMWLARQAGIKNRIAFYRNTNPGFHPSWYKSLYAWISYKLMNKNATKVFSNSKAALDKYHPGWSSERDKFKVIYNGLDMTTLSKKTSNEVRLSLNIPEGSFVIGHSGRANAVKNHRMIIACAEKLCSKYDNIIFLLMGSGTDTKFADVVSQKGLEGKVRLMGNRRDVLDILKCLDVYYFPSLSEGQPNALIEAMVSGIPIVASNYESIAEAVPEHMRPYLVSPYDEESNMNALERMYLDPEFRDSQKCEEWAKEHFDAKTNFEELKRELL